MGGPVDRSLLVGSWLHSHEEDSETRTVYRRADFDFPPSRGRRGFELGEKGTLVDIGIGPTDRSQQSQGSWRLSKGNGLELYLGSPDKPSRVLEIQQLGAKKLVVKKTPA